MTINGDYVLRKIAGEAMLVPTGAALADNNGIFVLTESGEYLWELLSSGVPEDCLSAKLTEIYDVDIATAKKDAEDFIIKLRSFGIVR